MASLGGGGGRTAQSQPQPEGLWIPSTSGECKFDEVCMHLCSSQPMALQKFHVRECDKACSLALIAACYLLKSPGRWGEGNKCKLECRRQNSEFQFSLCCHFITLYKLDFHPYKTKKKANNSLKECDSTNQRFKCIITCFIYVAAPNIYKQTFKPEWR